MVKWEGHEDEKRFPALNGLGNVRSSELARRGVWYSHRTVPSVSENPVIMNQIVDLKELKESRL